MADGPPFDEDLVTRLFGVPPAGSTLVFDPPMSDVLGVSRSSRGPVGAGRMPRLSIGLPVFNGERVISEALDALLGQTYEDFELIVSDNASTDGTADICRRYASSTSIEYVRQPHNIGLVPNHIFVMEGAKSELFKWASHDDLYARDLLERCVQALDEDPSAVRALVVGHVDRRSRQRDRCFRRSRRCRFAAGPDDSEHAVHGWDDYTYGVIRTLSAAADGQSRQLPLRRSARSIPSSPFTVASTWCRTGSTFAGSTTTVPSTRSVTGARFSTLDERIGSATRGPAVRRVPLGLRIGDQARFPLSSADRRESFISLAGSSRTLLSPAGLFDGSHCAAGSRSLTCGRSLSSTPSWTLGTGRQESA